MGAYSILYAPAAREALGRMPMTVRGEIRRHLAEIALVSDSFASDAADRASGTLHFELAGCVVSYAISDAHRTLTVLSISSA